MRFSDLKIQELINKDFKCGCGRTHRADIGHIEIGVGAVNALPRIIAGQGTEDGLGIRRGDTVYITADENTWDVAGEKVTEILEREGLKVYSTVLGHGRVHAAMEYVEELEESMPLETKLIIAIGSGTLNDMTRYLAFKNGLPYYIVATAPSMDGYASSISPIVVNGMKTTFEAKCADAIIGDTDFLRTAPDEMVAAGFGDIMGKYLAISDWRLSSIINGEYYCENIADLVLESVDRTIENIEGLRKRDPDALIYLMEALVLIGITISFLGYSRPASASEHHISHLMEMKSIQKGEYGNLHGTCVGAATCVIDQMYRRLLDDGFDYKAAKSHALEFNWDDWSQEAVRVFGPGAQEVIKLQKKAKPNEPNEVLGRIERIERSEDEIVGQLKSTLKKTQEVPRLLESLGGLSSLKDFDFSKEEWVDILVNAKDLRDRYATLQFFYDLGALERLSTDVVERQFSEEGQ